MHCLLVTSWSSFKDLVRHFLCIVSLHMWAALLLHPPQDHLTTSAKQLSVVFRKMPEALHCLDGSLNPIIFS